ncbi:Uncharacterised protein [Mycobacteroides abscessus subsp. abscessus]|nr:Uncharacterised protein [Mycobacteroides abscessus subsp. abscessus]SIN53188.1 Uncharacterised protein [Mycobacteroides abscessus subsp. abscessus]SKY87291.1 Uncharacterised protein [Mycobacteroides abscessus subsp. abscessus]
MMLVVVAPSTVANAATSTELWVDDQVTATKMAPPTSHVATLMTVR